MEEEDFDGFEDSDGCPDLDNDGDGIPDARDLCPNSPEDKDGYQDADGCPDPDNDEDGVLDAQDHCPNEALVGLLRDVARRLDAIRRTVFVQIPYRGAASLKEHAELIDLIEHPDFGRRDLALPPEQVLADVLYQIGALVGLARAVGVPVAYVKPHGALYNMACRADESARVGERGRAEENERQQCDAHHGAHHRLGHRGARAVPGNSIAVAVSA